MRRRRILPSAGFVFRVANDNSLVCGRKCRKAEVAYPNILLVVFAGFFD